MLEDKENSRILDILGNRNRRRIIELLRQKPCFVTEISERLTLSPKAVIEHLQLMEHEDILRFSLDERRRKYYYLASDIDVVVKVHRSGEVRPRMVSGDRPFFHSLFLLKRMIGARDNLITTLDQLERDIENKAQEILLQGREILGDEADIEIVFALGHYELTYDELQEYTSLPSYLLNSHLEDLMRKGIVGQNGPRYTLRSAHAK